MNPPQLIKVLGFSRAICYPCREECSRGYDELNGCYQKMVRTGEIGPALEARIEEMNRQ